MESQSFTYTAIPPGRFFRLLKIHPGSAHDPLVCDLFTAEIDAVPPYTALSYVWGDPTKSGEIFCSGHACNITQSLWDGLCRMRKADEVQIAWADAICINQEDNVEKGHQVDLMGVIYDKARDVLVWLGPDTTGSSEEAFRCLRTINQKVATGTDIEHYIPTKEEMPYTWVGISAGFRPRRDWQGLHQELYDLTWFSRVWVLQEVGIATKATAFWGDSSIDFAEIAEFIRDTYFNDDLKAFLGTEISTQLAGAPLYALWNVWLTYEKKGSWMYRSPVLRAFIRQLMSQCDIDFILVMEASRYFNATNKLDHVYAFLGHPKAKVPGTDRAWLQANYSLSVKEQHRLLAANIAQHSLNFLVQAHQTEESLKPDFEHPSWVPRWDAKTPSSPEHGGGQLVDLCWEIAQQKPSPYPKAAALEAFASTLVCHYNSRGEQPNDGRNRVVEQFAGFCMRLNTAFYRAHLVPERGFWSLDTLLNVGKMFDPHFKSYGTNRRFFNTNAKGYWGLGPMAMEKGDVCALPFGADVPFVLRPMEKAGEYKVVGQCYMYGYMDGDAVKRWGDRPREDIVLV